MGLPYKGLIRHFIDCIEAGIEPDVSVEYSVEYTELYCYYLEKHTGRPVPPLSEENQLAIEMLEESEK